MRLSAEIVAAVQAGLAAGLSQAAIGRRLRLSNGTLFQAMRCLRGERPMPQDDPEEEPVLCELTDGQIAAEDKMIAMDTRAACDAHLRDLKQHGAPLTDYVPPGGLSYRPVRRPTVISACSSPALACVQWAEPL